MVYWSSVETLSCRSLKTSISVSGQKCFNRDSVVDVLNFLEDI